MHETPATITPPRISHPKPPDHQNQQATDSFILHITDTLGLGIEKKKQSKKKKKAFTKPTRVNKTTAVVPSHPIS